MGGANVKITMIEGLLQKVAPHPCFGCTKIGTPLCDNCKYNIIGEPFTGCILCATPCSEGVCRKHDAFISRAWVVGERRNTLQKLIDGYKFQYMKSAAVQLAQLLDEYLPTLPTNTYIVPIPTTPSHIRTRGFDHLDILARQFAHIRDVPIARLLNRQSVATQHELNRKDRLLEARHAFTLKDELSVNDTDTYLVLDDVITTGATVSAAAQALALAGAKTIFVAALAYQPLD